MSDTEPQTAGGKVLWHFTMSLDGFVAGPNHHNGEAPESRLTLAVRRGRVGTLT
jgi:hypothetical protein